MAFSVRGVMEHLNGLGWLADEYVWNVVEMDKTNNITNLIVPEVFSCRGSITIPSSTAFAILNTAKDVTQAIYTEASARWEPKCRLR